MNVEVLPSRQQLLEELQISDRTLLNYCNYLQKHAGKQFRYKKRQQVFEPHQYRALKWLAECRRPPAWTDDQIVNHIIRNGL